MAVVGNHLTSCSLWTCVPQLAFGSGRCTWNCPGSCDGFSGVCAAMLPPGSVQAPCSQGLRLCRAPGRPSFLDVGLADIPPSEGKTSGDSWNRLLALP